MFNSSDVELRAPTFYAFEIALRIFLGFVAYFLPGIFVADVTHFFQMASEVGLHHLPYRDMVWEFPPLTLFIVPLVAVVAHSNAAFHVAFFLIMILCEWGSLHVLRTFDGKNYRKITLFWSLTVVPFSVLAWNRFDYVSVLFATLGLVAMIRGRSIMHWVLLGFLAKLWPVLLCVVLVTQRKYRQVVLIGVGVVVLTALWYGFSPSGFHDFLEFRRGAGFQIESIPGSVLHLFDRPYVFEFGTTSVSDAGWTWLQPVLFIGTIVGVGGMVIAAFIKKQHDDVMLVAACIAISVVCSRLISPQYLVWLAPFIALRVTTQRSIVVLYAMSLVLSFAVLYDYDYFANHVGTWIDAVAVLRNVILVTLTIVMIRAALFPKPADATSGPSISRTNVRGNA